MAAGDTPVLLREWTLEKSASIDWTNPDEVLAHKFSYLTMVSMHPKLEAGNGAASDVNKRSDYINMFLNPEREGDRRKTVVQWNKQGLFQLRTARWCRKCGQEGHTMPHCSYIEIKPDTKAHMIEHMNYLERLRLREQYAAKQERRGPRNKPSTGAKAIEGALSDEKWYQGKIKSFDADFGKGEVELKLNDAQDSYSFWEDRTEYGLQRIRIGDVVRFRIEVYQMRPIAIDVIPVQSGLSNDDVLSFLKQCDATSEPIRQMRRVLVRRLEWPRFLGALGAHTTQAVITIIRLTTFNANREAIHAPVFHAFLSLLGETNDKYNFFPSLVKNLVPNSGQEAVTSMRTSPTFIDVLLEISDLVMMMALHTDISSENLAVVGLPLKEAAEACLEAVEVGSIEAKKLKKALRFIATSREPEAKIDILPRPDELERPANMENSTFNPRNLPVNCTSEPYETTEAYVSAQARLLRADQFTTTTAIFAAGCFDLPNYTPDDHVAEDVAHARFYNRLRFMGRAVCRDFNMVDTVLLSANKWKGKHQTMDLVLTRGTLLIFYTGADRTVMDPNHLYFGLTTDPDSGLLGQNTFGVHPAPGQDFNRLTKQLVEAEAAGRLDDCICMESSVFFHGYAPVMEAMAQFCGAKAMQLPMEDIIVSEKEQDPDQLVDYIPVHCKPVFESIVNDIRTSLTLDKGQDMAMKSLTSSRMLLVQGPPGTGKSFIGCRIVESFVRYKQMFANGSALDYMDIEKMPHTDFSKLKPELGPVVVITYKNHALDEFLIDLKKSGLWDSERVGTVNHRFPGGCCMVRVGGGSQENELKGYNIMDILSAKAMPREVAQARGRVGVLNKRMEKLAYEITQLLRGKVPPAHLESWLSEDQRKTFRVQELREWLEGGKYVGKEDTTVSKKYFEQLGGELINMLAAPPPEKKAADGQGEPEDDGQQVSVFEAMRREVMKEGHEEARFRPSAIPREAAYMLHEPPQRPEAVPESLLSLWSLTPQQRHDYLAYLIRRAVFQRVREYNVCVKKLEAAMVLLRHSDDEAKLDLLRSADVVGLTTTGCAMNQTILRSLKPSMLVVEEAAEVLESQLIACMTDSLKQIVLIGDHYQLQPKVETMGLEKYNRMNVSMFERLVGRINPIMLVEQRRMKPKISRMVRPFYNAQELRDHESVLTRPFVDSLGNSHTNGMVPGLVHDVFFWKHTTAETESLRGRSKVNLTEATMALSLVEHLISCHVRPQSITIVTPYLGQKRLLSDGLKAAGKAMADVRTSTVDRFQGDEADVIILSLVRTERLTEFLRLRNRMIVSCSRARFAMVFLGNDELLLKSGHWRQVLEMLEEDKLVGEKLPVRTRFGVVEIPADTKYADWPTEKREREGEGGKMPVGGMDSGIDSGVDSGVDSEGSTKGKKRAAKRKKK